MKFVSWNVNGLKSCLNKGFEKFFNKIDADFFCIQETKLSENIPVFNLKNHKSYFNFSKKKGYSGTAIFTKQEPLNVYFGAETIETDPEGRIITLEYSNFYLVNVYIPTSQSGHIREDFRDEWEEKFRDYLGKIGNVKSLIVCGDFNATHFEIDSKIPKSEITRGFTDSDRVGFCEILEQANLVDTYRILHQNDKNIYTWWPYSRGKRDANAGARIDYFLISDYLENNLKKAEICSEIQGSDHCPIMIELDF